MRNANDSVILTKISNITKFISRSKIMHLKKSKKKGKEIALTSHFKAKHAKTFLVDRRNFIKIVV